MATRRPVSTASVHEFQKRVVGGGWYVCAARSKISAASAVNGGKSHCFLRSSCIAALLLLSSVISVCFDRFASVLLCCGTIRHLQIEQSVPATHGMWWYVACGINPHSSHPQHTFPSKHQWHHHHCSHVAALAFGAIYSYACHKSASNALSRHHLATAQISSWP